MVIRVGYFETLTPLQRVASQENWERRFKAALTAQPGLIAVFHCEREDGTLVSFSAWESLEAMTEGGARANAAPLLPGQLGEDIPSPDRVELWSVRDAFVGAAL